MNGERRGCGWTCDWLRDHVTQKRGRASLINRGQALSIVLSLNISTPPAICRLIAVKICHANNQNKSTCDSLTISQSSQSFDPRYFVLALPQFPFQTQPWQSIVRMSPSKNNSYSTSNRNGESVGRQANVLASAYCVDPSGRLSGFRKYWHIPTSMAGGHLISCFTFNVYLEVLCNQIPICMRRY
jgi:hypothetical protein